MRILAKQKTCQRYIFKIHSSRLRTAKWNLTLPLQEARRNEELVSLADSQVLRWLDELNGISDTDETAKKIKAEIREVRREASSPQNRHRIKDLYHRLDEVQFKPDYMCLIIDKEKDYHRACKGFTINGMRYKRLLGTNGGIKNSTIVFAGERHIEELRRRIDNGRDMAHPLVPAKLEAYKALSCSASIPVSLPHGILIVDDCETVFQDTVIYLTDEADGEPAMSKPEQREIVLNACDGCGMMLPALAERWSKELGLDYVVSGVNTRFSFEKGMVFTFDFIDFAEKVAGTYVVKDAWGNEVDVRDVEIVLPVSMVKLWDSYESCNDYVGKSVANGYTFGIAKTTPKKLETQRNLNYQFIQSFDLDADDIEELISTTMNEIKDVIGGDWRKAVLFLRGCGLTEDNVAGSENDVAKAIMIDHNMIHDPYIKSKLYRQIRKRIDEAKIGVLQVHGNFSIISGDLYALCQNMFGLPVTGILKAGEIYNKYWLDQGAEKLACFRAPMTCHNNIRMVHPCADEDAAYWYRHMTTCTVFNAFDTCFMALNGADADGDLVMLTDNPVLVRKHRALPALMCAQRKAAKKVATEDDVIRSNIDSFGNEIGQTTNWITSMFDRQANFEKGSVEYEALAYRIMCGQLFQQNSIDKAKGIVCKPMPKYWHDRHAIGQIEDSGGRAFQRSIVADKKAYFMRYIYPSLAKQYNQYITNTSRSCMREFGITIDELRDIPYSELTDAQKQFLYYYEAGFPVGTSDCVMNRICRRFEEEFDSKMKRDSDAVPFDHSIMKSGMAYEARHHRAIRSVFESYQSELESFSVYKWYEKLDSADVAYSLEYMEQEFVRSCLSVCSEWDKVVDILLDIAYKKTSTKTLVWGACSDDIIRNLLRNNNGQLTFPVEDPDGDIEYGGCRFKEQTIKIGEIE